MNDIYRLITITTRKADEGLLAMQYPAYLKGENGVLQGVVTAIISMLWNVVMERRFMNFAGQGRAE